MLPVCSPSDANGDTKIFALASVTGLTEWVDYIPVQTASLVASEINRTSPTGFRQVNSLASDSGLAAWKDYVPVFVTTGRTTPWNTGPDGYIPMYAATGSLAAVNQPTFSNVLLLLAFDGDDQSTTVTDLSEDARVITVAGNAQHDTAQFKYGSSSLLLDDSGDWITIPQALQADLGYAVADNQMTLECFFRPDAGAPDATNVIFGGRGTTDGFSLYHLSTGVIHVSAYDGSTSLLQQASTGTLTAETWYHICLEQNGTSWKLYIDGTLDGDGTATGTPTVNASDAFSIGAGSEAAGRELGGHIDQVRFVQGENVYGGNFTPPTQAHPTS